MTPELPLSVRDVVSAHERIRSAVVRTPVVPAPELAARAGAADAGLKLEMLQPTGSFKVRGAAARILALDARAAGRGVVTASTGNHGRAVAHVAGRRGIPAAVCVSENVPAGKIAALEGLGCELRIGGRSQSEALATAAELVADRGMTLVHPFDDLEVIAGQGTIGLEILAQRPETATILVPLSGGGLLAGIALAAKAARSDVRVIGVSMRAGAVMAASLAAGRPVDLDEAPTLADSLQGGIGGHDNRYTFELVRALVDEVVHVSEDEIWEGMRYALDQHRVVLEGAGAVGIAALLAGRVEPAGAVVVVCSGGNVEPTQLEALARGGPRPGP